MLFLGCDAGSTKTEILIADSRGTVLAHEVSSSCNYLLLGREEFGKRIREKIEDALKKACTAFEGITYSVYGFPVYGEMEEMECGVPEAMGNYAPPMHSMIVNDAVIAFAGSLGGKPGINVLSGTGSGIYGEDAAGNHIRVGGWSLLFDDEGSCAWVARKTLSLFFRQADGRLPAGPLLDVFKEHFHLKDNLLYFVGDNLRTLSNDRTALAQVQLLAAEAVHRGDESAAEIYKRAVEKPVSMVDVASGKLSFPKDQEIMVSYSGGFVKNGDLVMVPFEKTLAQKGYNLTAPMYKPVVGAVAMAARQYLELQSLNRMLSKIQKNLDAENESTHE